MGISINNKYYEGNKNRVKRLKEIINKKNPYLTKEQIENYNRGERYKKEWEETCPRMKKIIRIEKNIKNT